MAKIERKVQGNTASIRRSVLLRLEEIYTLGAGRGAFITGEAAEVMAWATAVTNREIAVMIDRRGVVQSVSVGSGDMVSLFGGRLRRGERRASGVRCVHTHPNGDPRLSDVDLSALENMRLDAMALLAVSDEGRVVAASAALHPPGGELVTYGPWLARRNPNPRPGGGDADGDNDVRARDGGVAENILRELDALLPEISLRDAETAPELFDTADDGRERAVLVGVRREEEEEREPLAELADLAWTAGADVVEKLLYRERETDAAHYVGKGKLEELSKVCQNTKADVVIFDEELSGIQARNIENTLGVKVVDRTVLILDIFAGRARTREGKLQVELAQLNYSLSRLTGQGGQLSRLGGGIGTRGPGEKKLDTDRRHIRRRLNQIESELKKTRERRDRTRNTGRLSGMPVVAFVGYTNAGKSTLFNALCGASVFAEDKLFATLDPTARKLDLPAGGGVIAVDTVGFINKLPHELVDAFKATLEESVYADTLLHVVDISNPEARSQMETVERILADIGAKNKKTLVAFNKADLVDMPPEWTSGWRLTPPERATAGLRPAPASASCVVSALTGQGMNDLLAELTRLCEAENVKLDVLIPYKDGRINSYIHENARVLREDFTETGVSMSIVIGEGLAGWLRHYAVRA